MPRPKILIAQRYESGARMASRLFVGREYDKYMLDFAENLQMAINTMRHANDAGDPYRAVISSVLFDNGQSWEDLYREAQKYTPHPVFIVYTSIEPRVPKPQTPEVHVVDKLEGDHGRRKIMDLLRQL